VACAAGSAGRCGALVTRPASHGPPDALILILRRFRTLDKPTRQANIMACETKAGVVELWFVNPDWTDGGLSAV
jgi:hypothetical protein